MTIELTKSLAIEAAFTRLSSLIRLISTVSGSNLRDLYKDFVEVVSKNSESLINSSTVFIFLLVEKPQH